MWHLVKKKNTKIKNIKSEYGIGNAHGKRHENTIDLAGGRKKNWKIY